MRGRLAFAALLLLPTGAAHAITAGSIPAELGGAMLTLRESYLAAGIAVMMTLGLASFFLGGRIAERTHVALALLGVLVGAFCLFVMYGLSGREYPAAGALIMLGLVGLFKLMNQFEIRRKPDRPQGPRNE